MERHSRAVGMGRAEAPIIMGMNPRALLIEDHERLEQIFVDLKAAFALGDREEVARLWTAFDAGLTAHLAAEEEHILPLFKEVDAKEAETVLKDHERIRAGLADLAVRVDLHMVRKLEADAFVEHIQAHARRENELMYRWAEQHLDEESRVSLLGRLRDLVKR